VPPASTYRLQMHAGFGLADALRLVPYLASLGVDALYLSPIFAAVPGSAHGYDVVDPNRVNPELGTEEDLRALAGAARAHGMGLVLDIVPNHMAASADNRWWWDVLKHGRDSEFAGFFDIDWEAQDGRVLLPVLGAPLVEVLEAGELEVGRHEGEEVVRYHEHRFPLAPGTESAADLTELLARQHYRLAFWRVAAEEINYRRFFDINDLVSVRVENPSVFEATHSLILRLVREGVVTDLRVDHIDGLHDPTGYLERLRASLDQTSALFVEKILGEDEQLPAEWPVDGTTGYEFADAVGGAQTDADGARLFREAADELAGADTRFGPLAVEGKRTVIEGLFPEEVRSLARELYRRCRDDPRGLDLTPRALHDALVRVTGSLRVYRTYTRNAGVRDDDRRFIEEAVREAGDDRAVRFLGRVLLLEEDPLERWLPFVMRFQQLTGPITAKGVEDTALYRYGGLLSRAEVGASPEVPVRVTGFHERMAQRQREWPGSLNATTTHDTKRSEDVRARLAVLSEMPEAWFAQVRRWRHRFPAPDVRMDLHLYQALVGAWPLERGERRRYSRRLQAYAVKVAREAKLRTSWLDPDEGYERALRRWVRSVVRDRQFERDVERLLRRIALPGAVNSLAQALVKITAPGVPDLYQGTELWTLSLVDPDNRRPVDFERRTGDLERLGGADPAELLSSWEDGRIKLHVTSAALRLRRARRALFSQGGYVPLAATGSLRGNVVAFARRREEDLALTVVPRLVAGLTSPGRAPLGHTWKGTRLRLPTGTPGELQDVLTGRTVAVRGGGIALSEAFEILPLALLVPV
jgi:(1->4)-alpha-D-glucan 1-alpha-D-glucosylmutase